MVGANGIKVGLPGAGLLWAGLLWAGLLAETCCLADEPPADPIDFDREIRPILADKCFACHGPDEAARQAGVRLDLAETALATSDSGIVAIVPGDPEGSELVARITESDESIRMPPPESNLELTAAEQRKLIQWIRNGARYEQHWSLASIRRPVVPLGFEGAWPANEIDAFILRRLQSEKLKPASQASLYRLVRRVYLDLVGVPPTPEQADVFVNDPSPDAYSQLVDRLLAQPEYGERMSWEWLDAARYADSNGYQGDRERTMWPWRDWVVAALNENLRFDTFTIWQLAGDLLEQPTEEQVLATGFCRNHMINGEGGRIPEENRVDYVMDMAETTGTVWLGLTFNCCRCHDHKFDPLLRKDYYGLFAFFNQTPVTGAGGDPQTPPVLDVPDAAQRTRLEQLERDTSERRRLVQQMERDQRDRLLAVAAEATAGQQQSGDEDDAARATLASLLETPLQDRSVEDLRRLAEFAAELSPPYSRLVNELAQREEDRKRLLSSIPKVMVMRDQQPRRPTFMLKVGLYNKPEEAVEASFPQILRSDSPPAANRLDLARWLVSPDHPLTSRVIVNRVWQHFFGQGIVKTAEDFGTQGERPTHPQLLDWLAVEFRESDWDLKRLCRLIVTSHTYRQSSMLTAQLRERDPENRLLARGARYRLPSWIIRDQALAASGLLVRQTGGPPVHPYQPPGVWEEATFGNKTYQLDDGSRLYRRSLYTFWRRIVAPTGFFDTASRQACAVRPSRTNSPLHALTTWNDITYIEAARVLAQQVLQQLPSASDEERITAVFRRILVRPPSDTEVAILVNSLAGMRMTFASRPEDAERFVQVGEYKSPPELDPVQLAALGSLCNLIFNLDEAVTKE